MTVAVGLTWQGNPTLTYGRFVQIETNHAIIGRIADSKFVHWISELGRVAILLIYGRKASIFFRFCDIEDLDLFICHYSQIGRIFREDDLLDIATQGPINFHR